MINIIDYPVIYFQKDRPWKACFVIDGKLQEFSISERNVGILLESIGAAFAQRAKSPELVEWERRVAV